MTRFLYRICVNLSSLPDSISLNPMHPDALNYFSYTDFTFFPYMPDYVSMSSPLLNQS